MDEARFDVVNGTVAASAVTILVDRASGQSWILDGSNRHDALWRTLQAGPSIEDRHNLPKAAAVKN